MSLSRIKHDFNIFVALPSGGSSPEVGAELLDDVSYMMGTSRRVVAKCRNDTYALFGYGTNFRCIRHARTRQEGGVMGDAIRPHTRLSSRKLSTNKYPISVSWDPLR